MHYYMSFFNTLLHTYKVAYLQGSSQELVDKLFPVRDTSVQVNQV